MGVKKKKTEASPMHEQIAEGLIQAVKELYNHHSGEIQENLDESESKKLAIGFNCELDCSESEPMVTVKIRFSTSVTDKRVFRVDDENQVQLFSSRAEAEPKSEEQTETPEEKGAE